MKKSEFVRLIKTHGAVLVRHGSSHDIYERDGKTTQVPRHCKELGTGIVNSMLKDLGIR